VAVTPTASGKTLCYNLPVLTALLSDAGARASTYSPPKPLPRTSCGAPDPFDSPSPPRRCLHLRRDTPQDVRSRIRRRLRSSSPTPTCSTRASSPTTRGGRASSGSSLRGDRRDARVPGHLRLPRGQRASKAPAGGPVPRHRPVFLLSSATIANPSDLARRPHGLRRGGGGVRLPARPGGGSTSCSSTPR